MARRKIDEKRLRELQMKQGNGRGPGSRFGGLKEKPKDLKKTLKQLMKYIGYSKKLLIGLIIVVILSFGCSSLYLLTAPTIVAVLPAPGGAVIIILLLSQRYLADPYIQPSLNTPSLPTSLS